MDIDEESIDTAETDAKKANAISCQCHSVSCGNYLARRNQFGSKLLKDLSEDVGHLFNADVFISECELICMRSPVPLHPNGPICGYHRFSWGVDYRPSSMCKCYFHSNNSKGKGVKISWRLYSFLKRKDATFILGSLVCSTCQKKLKSMMQDDESDSEIYDPCESIIDDDERNLRRAKLDNLTSIFGIDRIRYQLKTDVTQVSNQTLNYFRNTHRLMSDRLTDVFCELVAPGLEEQMKKVVLEDKNAEENDSYSTLMHLKESFESCNTRQARISLLTLVPKGYSKKEVSDLFQCSLYEIQKARSISKLYGSCPAPPKKNRSYSRLSVEKCKHFIDFLFTTGLLQEVAYGTTNLKLDSGERVAVSNTILNGLHERAVREYIIHCKELNYDALGRSTLLNVLEKMKPHTRKKLAGVDSFVVEGVEAFEVSKSTSLRQNYFQSDLSVSQRLSENV